MATLYYSSSNWTDSTPYGLDQDSYGGDSLKFNRLTTSVSLPSTDHKIVKLTISSSASPGYKVGYFTVTSPDGTPMSVNVIGDGESIYQPVVLVDQDDTAYLTHTKWYDTDTNSTSTKEILINVNGADGLKTTLLDLHIDIGASLGYTNAAEDVNVTIDCTYATPTKYTAGLHPYSPYDAKDGSSTLTTEVWALTSLTAGALLYSDFLLTKPALPYYYGIGSSVYQVGEELDRDFGTILKIKVKPRLFTQPKTEYRYVGPTKNWYVKGKKRKEPTTRLIRDEWHDDSSYDYSPMNIEPFVSSIGKISRTYANASIPQPSVYRYYLTWGSTLSEAQSKWRFWDFNDKKHHSMNGGFNAIFHLAKAYSNALTPNIQNDGNYAVFSDGNAIKWLSDKSRPEVQDDYEGLLVMSAILLATEIPGLIKTIAGKKMYGGLVSRTMGTIFKSAATANIVSVVILVIIIIVLLVSILRRTWLIENLPALKNVFGTGPFIDFGDNLYKNDSLTTEIDSEYYSDGIYAYTYTSNVTSKGRVNKTAIIGFDIEDDNQRVIRLREPFAVDSPTLVTDWQKLIALPYTSGKPVPGKTVAASTSYSSAATSGTTSYAVGTFEVASYNSIQLEEGIATSYVSQADADAKAAILLSASKAFITGSSRPGYVEDEYLINSNLFYFTHTIKVENTPKALPLFYTGSLTAGTDLYYDEGGRVKVLNGYYSTGSAGSNFRDFHLVESGSIVKTEVMATAGSTTTVSGKPVDTANLDFTSAWAYNTQNKSTTFTTAKSIIDTHLYDTSQLLGNPNAKRIIVSGSNRVSDRSNVKVYSGTGVNATGSFISQPTGWYSDITRWAPGSPREVASSEVYALPSKTVRVTFWEDCTWQSGSNERGVYVRIVSGAGGGTLTTPIYPVDLSFEVESATGTVGTYRTTVPGNLSRVFVPIVDDTFEPSEYFTDINLGQIFSKNPNNGVTIDTSDQLSKRCQAPAEGGETIFISAVRTNCDDLCWQSGDTSYLVNNSSNSTETYANITIGTYITDVVGNVPNYVGFIAAAASSTQTSDTANVKILEVDNFGFVTSIIQCSAGSCSNPL